MQARQSGRLDRSGHAVCFALGEFSRQYAIYGFLTEPGSLPFAGMMAWLTYWVWFPGVVLMSSLPLYFPNGRLLSRRWRWAVLLAVAVVMTAGGFAAIRPGDEETPGIPNPLGIEGLQPFIGVLDVIVPVLWVGVGLVSAVSLVLRFRRSRGEERQQIKWVVYAVVFLISVAIVDQTFLENLLPPAADEILFVVVLESLWAAIAVAILRYRLYDIDIIINRTLVYGALTLCIVGIYVLAVGYLGALLRTEGNLLISLVATGLVAVVFAPLRHRLQKAVDRLMYGERDDPYAVLSRLGQRLEATLAPEAALRTVVETIAQALKLPYAAIKLEQRGGYATAAEYGTPVSETVVLPLTYGAEQTGQLVLAPRAPGEVFSPSDRRLLDDLARQAGAAVHAVRLTADLQRSREWLVTAREEERRRLRRDLHDGLGPQLAAQTLKVGSARSLYSRDPAAADALLSELEADLEAALSDLRRLVYDLRPPALDELGLAGAVREAAAQYGTNGLNVSVDAPERPPALPAAVEVAAYRIVREALTNVVRYARAENCDVSLLVRDELRLEIADDGAGLSAERTAGVGLSSMRERAAELGGECRIEASPTGGTRVLARLPLPPAEQPPDEHSDADTNLTTGDERPAKERM